MFDDVFHENNPFNNVMKAEDICINNNLSDNTDQKDIKEVYGDVL